MIVSRGYLNNNNTAAGDHHQQQQQRSSTSIEEDTNVMMMGLQQHSNRHNLVEKIKMAFSNEKRKGKSSSNSHQHAGQSDTSSSSDEELESPLQPILSRQSTQYNALSEIIEEPGIGSHSGY